MRRVQSAGLVGTLGIVAATVLAGCGDVTAPNNLSILDIDVGVPTSWLEVGRNAITYAVGTETHAHSGRYALAIASNDTSQARFAGVGQFVKADAYRGKRVRLTAWVRQLNVVGTDVGLWMRVDGPGTIEGFDNFSTRSLSGTSDWHQVSVVLDVPDDAEGIAFGALMSGSGEFLVDDMTFEVIPPTGPTTNLLTDPAQVQGSDYSGAPLAPLNLNFEAHF